MTKLSAVILMVALAANAAGGAFAGGKVRVAQTVIPEGTGFCFSPEVKGFNLLNDDYAVIMNGNRVEVRACRESRIPFNRVWPGRQRPLDQTERASYIACEAAGPIACRVTPKHAVKRAVVRPLSKGVSASLTDGTASFTLPGPGYYVLETDGPHKALHIFVEKPRTFAEAADATLHYGPGVHVAGLVRLKSHDRVYIDRDAIVFGCFTGENVEDVKISGHGVIDGRVCERVFDGCYSPLQFSCLRFHGSRGISVDGPVLMDSPNWVLAVFGCEDVDIRHIKIVGQWRYNTDGVDICNSRRVAVRDSFVRSFDDTIAIKGVPPLRDLPVEDVTVERCVLWCGWGKTIEPGIETWAPCFRNIRFSDCDLMRNAHAAINISAGGTAVQEDFLFENIRVELNADDAPMILQESDGIRYDPAGKKGSPMLVKVDNSHYGCSKNETFGHVRNCTFRDIAVFSEDGVPPPQIMVVSQTPAGGRMRPFENIVFERFSINGKAADWSQFSFFTNTPVRLAMGADRIGDAAKMGAEMMNPGNGLGCLERKCGGGFKVLIYGNSIALHAPKADIGWTNRCGMAASAPEKDFAHLVVAGLESKLGKKADFRIRNLATLERNFTTNIAAVAEIAADADWRPDYVVVAIGENVPNIDTSNAAAYRKYLADIARPFADGGAKIVMRSPFWRNAAKADCTAKAAAEVGAVYVDAGHLGGKDENKALGLFSHGGVANHPGDLGMKRLADLILAAYK